MIDPWLSPSFRHSKLENPTVSDRIDVYEDLWQHYILAPVEALLSMPYGDVAAMTLLSSYYESAWAVRTGRSSKGRSKQFFVAGFGEVYQADQAGIDHAAAAIYGNIRCGLAHQGMLSYKVQYTRSSPKAFVLTYPKRPDGSLAIAEGAVSIVVNAKRMYKGVREHFAQTVAELRRGQDISRIDAFVEFTDAQWAMDTGPLVICGEEGFFQSP